MAVVLSSEDNSLFSPPALRRTHSQPKFVGKQSSGFHTSSSTSRISDAYNASYHHQSYHIVSDSNPSSAPSSPRTAHADSADPSYSSTPATNLSLDGHCEDDLEPDDDRILLPAYDSNPFFPPALEDDLEAPTSPQTGNSYTISPPEEDSHDSSATTSRPITPEFYEHAEDDTAVKHHPTQHVDYLSHNWKEEDIWSSWRYIVSRRNEYSNGPRLENASWRTWMKAKYRLKTVSPETLNWLKDCDVTWLYGPLQTRQLNLFPNDTEHGSSTLSRNDSFVNKKPILKKRSMSEIMLQRSLSSSSLLKQATAAIQAQQKDRKMTRPILHQASTDFMTFPFSSRRMSRENTSRAPSTASSGVISPSTERKHIHFDEQVKQCIAVDSPGDDEEEEEVGHGHWKYDNDSDSDDGAIMMKRTNSKKKPLKPRKSLTPVSAESKTIAMLPSTTLKYRKDTPEPRETAMKHSTGLRSPLLSPTSSQETLRPSRPSGPFYAVDNDEENTLGDETSTTPVSSPVEAFVQNRQPGLSRSGSTNSLTAEPAGMRRTESGMFMPYEEGEVRGNDGIIGRVIDTVNTARDIAHVIWNVGWKR
ncbi:protein phosphatase type 1 complex subunit Hex2/Reg1 [Pseudomassariella vexata]|uniref:Protein phosphatase type 1 complex subunit Hex2/Reg1 n=1 Tax=Pseudomassariella vexata TaxID=1141098 RepID=A0A1Y2E499_9PEZI|nr:protein phosphatase type 1 complex subunit Hex2/Reg1 [Pseudomassariella vexata]ORY66381.1 protein phosphatase type 1 complex subunit Hex2/Reg1 [Pseudomassariella vexata]